VNYKLTIFTATYNRQSLLKRCYESLRQQSDNGFIWLVIDDGSTDSTENLVRGWMMDNHLNIIYRKQTNMGKHVAHNTALGICSTPFFATLDSDDAMDRDAVKSLRPKMNSIEDNDNLAGIIGNWLPVGSEQFQLNAIPEELVEVSGMELYQRYGFKGETFRVYKTRVLLKYLYPVIPGEKFLSENVAFDRIDDAYKMLVTHAILSYGDYLSDGLSKNLDVLKRNNPIGYSLSLASSSDYSIKKFNKIKYSLLYIVWTKKMKVPNGYKNFKNKAYYIALLLPAHLLMLLNRPAFIFRVINFEDL
jgi:glycosyltransferase involved in cell wall biosynthesis